MALPHQSIATINSPQFINLQPLDINPLMSSCEIKVLYIGENRNRSYISKEVATEMAKTLRGAPIVGYYKESKEDFTDHGEQVIFDDQGIHFNCLTKPYGFVSPDAKVWFQKFNDSDDFGNQIERQYLMTTGYLWTGQFEEVQSVVESGRPQSMELEEATLDGHWATNVKNNIEFFIINDATFTKLCILGDETEPCFEGASVTKPDISTNFSMDLDKNFKQTLFTMINELRDALKGGNEMAKEEFTSVEQEEVNTSFEQQQGSSEPTENPTPVDTFTEEQAEEKPETDFENNEEKPVEETSTEFEKKEDQEEEDNTSDNSNEEDNQEEDEKKKYSLLEQQYNDLSAKYTQLKEEYDSLIEFKLKVENEQKDALINEFYMLSEEDKKEIIENKVNYTLDEIKAKLAVICYDKKVNFNSESMDEIDNNKEQDIVTYTYNDDSSTNLPDWVKAVKNIEENK